MLSPSVTTTTTSQPPRPYLADIDECLNDTICSNHGFCENTAGSFRCHCDQGYTNPPGDTSKCVGMYMYLHTSKSELCLVTENSSVTM